MKRFHVHVGVADLDSSIRFYSGLFGAEPSVRKVDYAKWMVDEPRLNFAISTTAQHQGVSHLGLEADSAEELADIERRFKAADGAAQDQPNAACCYARSDKHWATDPQGIQWEGFHSRGLLEDEPHVGDETRTAASVPAGACCAPAGSAQSAGAQAPRTTSGCCA
jgi:catechol 2,3-dioxygenase-like lactoylglutathione lyase family enzyme